MAKRTRKLEQLDLIDYIESVSADTEPCRIQYRVEILPDGRQRTWDYSHLPYERRPLAQYQQQQRG